ncbi:uncharacterized protein FIBRA_03379 [Fibroporia radiculosa]|uniref:START domain-containing protein n=1 Tax=Fibroporia radiculosa TaxID=599839 RepID=J4GNG1_9APHY|nr:uncharacterized protein FIBRA_03379 [Fibroporia radiculosa]CCM01330.1 predicted protein [Fibroporia radiculosa]
MLDGTGLRQSWYASLDDADTYFRQLLASHASPDWKRTPLSVDSSGKGKARASPIPEVTDVLLHRKAVKGGDTVYRAILDVPITDAPTSLECWKAVLSAPELRKEWDPAVESAHIIEMLDQATRVSKINFTLGWPANPRDAVIVSRSFNDSTTLVDISTSLPRSPDAPVFIRPSPPYVRSEVALFAWCVQLINDPLSPSKYGPRIRITCFWQHNLKALWTFNSTSSLAQQLCAMMIGLYKTVKERGARVPQLIGFGNGVSVERVRFEVDREALTLDYSIVPEDDDDTPHTMEQGLNELYAVRQHRRLARSVECALPASVGWDVQITTKASSEQVSQLPWTAHATRSAPTSDSTTGEYEKVIFAVKHATLPNDHVVLKVRVTVELSGPSSGIRINGIPQSIEQVEERDPLTHTVPAQVLQDMSSAADMSLNGQSSMGSIAESASRSSTIADRPQLRRAASARTAAGDKSILSRVKRNYIYFSSLMQEPEAKWKRNVEARGVTIAQLDSIDPTLVVYRAEATFVGLGLWDLYSAIATPGARAYWDKLYDDSVLIEDLNELTELWHHKTKPAWPVTERDSVVLKTVYKSPTTIHIFAFSADDPNLFPHVPPADPNVIRTQIDLQGWAIEALSPTTTQLTLLEQSDPKGWSNKASIPQQMILAVAGVGEFAIRCGGPPIVTRLEGARAMQSRYDHERGNFRFEYEPCTSRRTSGVQSSEDSPTTITPPPSAGLPVIECELRCDLDNWASSLDIVVDPPPQSISCLRRHRLSSGGGGLWLTITHDAVGGEEERLQIIVRRGPMSAPKEKGLVMVNGAKVDVDVEELPDREVKNLQKRKRVKPARVPLDQPPVIGVIRRRRAEWDADAGTQTPDEPSRLPTPDGIVTSVPTFVASFNKFFSFAVEQATVTTQQAVAAISPAMVNGMDAIPSASKPPMQYALEALSYLQSVHARPKSEGWALVSEKDFPVYRKTDPEISPVIPVHKGEKVIEGVSAEELASVLANYDCRKNWDTRFDSVHVFEVFGADLHTEFVVMKGAFPFRDRGFYLASLTARETASSSSSRRIASDLEHSQDQRAAIYCVSASFSPESVSSFSPSKYNSYSLPVGRVYVDGWILETLDPYGAENYAIPSTKCTRVVAVDYAGSVPAAVNSMINGMLPKSIIAVESYVKSISSPPLMRLPSVGLALSPVVEDPLRQTAWTLRRRDSNRTLIAARYDPANRAYKSSMIINSSTALSPRRSSHFNDATPKARRMTLTVRAKSPPDEQRQSRSEELSDLPPSTSQTKSVSPDPGRSRSRDGARTSTFTSRGEVRHPKDLLVSELVIDSKLYPDGYEIHLASRIDRSKTRVSLSSPVGDAPPEQKLPFSYSAFTLPPSPLHSAGLNTDRPPRHLLRLTLPTAQYQVSTIQDPLTGEVRSAPPKPQWFSEMEEGRVILEVQIKPAPAGRSSKKTTVTADGNAVTVLAEKESLSSLGRDDLVDSRALKMDLLAGSSGDGDAIPEELQEAVAVADHLLEDASLALQGVSQRDTPDTTKSSSAVPEDSADAGDNMTVAEKFRVRRTHQAPQVAVSIPETPAADSSTNGLLRFLNAYPNPLLRFTTQSRRSSVHSPAAPSCEHVPGSIAGDGQRKDGAGAPDARGERVGLLSRRAGGRGSYPLSTVVIVALIAFLVGSFLRSLLSPADFIYVVPDRREFEEASAGWRELRRLFEVKYVLGGWDFQIAAVRRH